MTNPVQSFLDGEKDENAFHKAVAAAVKSMLGAQNGPYSIDAVEYLAAAIDCSLYAHQHGMQGKPRFGRRPDLLRFSVNQMTLAGLVLEFGVFSGNTINVIADMRPNDRVYGFDSFEGLPGDWTPEIRKGTFRRTDLPKVRGNVELVVGWFHLTLAPFLEKHPGPVSFLHMDCDLYDSAKIVFDLLGDRIAPGTIIVFDEYFNYPDWRLHEYKAFQEFVTRKGVKYEYIGLVPFQEQVAVRIL